MTGRLTGSVMPLGLSGISTRDRKRSTGSAMTDSSKTPDNNGANSLLAYQVRDGLSTYFADGYEIMAINWQRDEGGTGISLCVELRKTRTTDLEV